MKVIAEMQLPLMNGNSIRNFTPLPDSLSPRQGGSFMSRISHAFKSLGQKKVVALGGMFALVLAVFIGVGAAQRTTTLVTPAQTINNASSSLGGDSATTGTLISCPIGYDQIGTSSTISDADITRICPSGDIIKMGGPVAAGDSSTISGTGDTMTTSQIVCCRKLIVPPTEAPQTTPSSEITNTPNACVAPEIHIEKIELICPNCTI